MEHQFASGDTLFNSALDPGVEAVVRADIGSIRGGTLIYNTLPHRTTYYHVSLPFATSFWRSLGLLANAFAIESFIDELALKTNQDPVQMRLNSIGDDNPYSVRAKKSFRGLRQKSWLYGQSNQWSSNGNCLNHRRWITLRSSCRSINCR